MSFPQRAKITLAKAGDVAIDGVDELRGFVLSLGGRQYPALVKRWCNFLASVFLLMPHAPMFHAPPDAYNLLNLAYGPWATDRVFGVLLLLLATTSWALSFTPQRIEEKGHWWTALISCTAWFHVFVYLWGSWWAHGGDFLPIHFLSLVPLFTSFFVPLRMSSERQGFTFEDDFKVSQQRACGRN